MVVEPPYTLRPQNWGFKLKGAKKQESSPCQQRQMLSTDVQRTHRRVVISDVAVLVDDIGRGVY